MNQIIKCLTATVICASIFMASSCASNNNGEKETNNNLTNKEGMEKFEKISWEDFNENAISIIGQDWMLISAGTVDGEFNMMTASWGSLGWLWQKPVSKIFVRPQRHTFNFTEEYDYYTITFYDEKYRDVLQKMGTVSGRDFDKMNYSELTPVATENNSVGFAEAKYIIECKKLFSTVINPDDFIDKKLEKDIYPKKDYHTMYIGEIVNIWRRK